MSFPFETDADIQETEAYKEPCEYGIDFNTGQLTGNKAYGLEAIKVWIWTALRTARYRHAIYSWDYGHELDNLIGKGYTQEYINTELPRMIEECLLINPNIIGADNFSFIIYNDRLIGSFKVKTVYGEAFINV